MARKILEHPNQGKIHLDPAFDDRKDYETGFERCPTSVDYQFCLLAAECLGGRDYRLRCERLYKNLCPSQDKFQWKYLDQFLAWIKKNAPDPTDITFPVLYKVDAKGAMMVWKIWTEGNKIITEWGKLGGKHQHTEESVLGKNTGRSNETTPDQQAVSEAESRWNKQNDDGYVESLEMAERGDDNIGIIKPMLAQDYTKHGHKMPDAVYVSIKYDGIRILSVITKDKTGRVSVDLYSRNRKKVKSLPHIEQCLKSYFTGYSSWEGTIVLDGEAYTHSIRVHKGFEKIQEIVMRSENLHPKHHLIQYHVFDIVTDEAFADRLSYLNRFRNIGEDLPAVKSPVKLVSYVYAKKDQLDVLLGRALKSGYEGIMIRHPEGKYESGKRSYHLQKYKKFEDAEFKIIDVKEGKGKMAGHAVFTCITDQGRMFDCKMKGSMNKLKEYWENAASLKDKMITVRYLNLTEAGVPRHPNGLRIREEE